MSGLPVTEYYFVEMNFGSEGVLRYTSKQSTTTFAGHTYRPVEGINITLPENTVGADSTLATVELPSSAYGLSYFSDGAKHAQGTLTVCVLIGSATYYLFKGKVESIIANPKGRYGITRVMGGDDKYYNDRPAGVSCNVTCARMFSQGGCTATQTTKSLTVVSVGNLQITVSANADSEDVKYIRGYVTYTGARITIRKWDTGTAVLFLTSQPPSSWAGKTIQAKSGCIGSIEACRAYFNETQFLGLGVCMVPYSPTTDLR